MTKTLSCIALLICLSSVANAQFSKGDILLGGTLSWGSNKNTYSHSPGEFENSNGYFNISLGKAIRENAVAGLNLTYQPSTNSYNSVIGKVKLITTGYTIGVFYRLYKNLGKEFYLFGEAGAAYSGSSSRTEDSLGNKVSQGSSSGFQIYLYPGIAYKISKKFFLEVTIPQLFAASYSSSKTEPVPGVVVPDGYYGSSKNLNIGLYLNSNFLSNLGIGFRLIL